MVSVIAYAIYCPYSLFCNAVADAATIALPAIIPPAASAPAGKKLKGAELRSL
jgi:hypothetical protein